eukprot:2993481-Prymnesium_polylepis.1
MGGAVWSGQLIRIAVAVRVTTLSFQKLSVVDTSWLTPGRGSGQAGQRGLRRTRPRRYTTA